ncbi:MAG TPA: excinuclease ABC subunit UvrB [Clostridia bacterium]|nr:MAG: UvrABC system protein B [Firmicutes bacterium ADurb.Bin146]HOD93698.1 excinuclease ABC subunit UvrB [Clostridia bacterium]HQM38867.1 excinuclease ABC subunit UvrB [Clostridia bacterium]
MDNSSKSEKFVLKSEYRPTGDQPQAIEALAKGVIEGQKHQTLLGVTGSGKTFTMANIIEKVQKPTLVIAHNKTLAAQLCSEFKEFFPENSVEYFVSYYDYFQPEAYIPSTDTYIEKDLSINDEIDQLRHAATSALLQRRDVIIVASVSCIYGLGDPADYKDLMLYLGVGMIKDRDEVIKKLVEIQYSRNEIDFKRGTFRAKGDSLEVAPSNSANSAYRISFFGDEIERITQFDPLTGELTGNVNHLAIFPASHFVSKDTKLKKALEDIQDELEERVSFFEKEGKIVEAYRLKQRTNYDLEMIKNIGFCSGIENYSRHIDGRKAGQPPATLLSFYPEDFLMFIDESHVTVPQIGGMHKGDKSRKKNLIEYGFRLPSAYDNRPLTFEEFKKKQNQCIYVSATPGDYEIQVSQQVAEQIIRPTGLMDPKIEIRPVKGQIDDLLSEIQDTISRKNRVLVTTLTKRMAEKLTEYYTSLDVKVQYLHSDIETLERIQILKQLRDGTFDVLIGINLLREGIDLPEVELVAILDADKEGFLRCARSLIQTAGRAARNVAGRVIMYADTVTDSMKAAINETDRRRAIQKEYNQKNNITPSSIVKEIRDNISFKVMEKQDSRYSKAKELPKTEVEIIRLIDFYERQMKRYAKLQEYENAARYRDMIKELRDILNSGI